MNRKKTEAINALKMIERRCYDRTDFIILVLREKIFVTSEIETKFLEVLVSDWFHVVTFMHHLIEFHLKGHNFILTPIAIEGYQIQSISFQFDQVFDSVREVICYSFSYRELRDILILLAEERLVETEKGGSFGRIRGGEHRPHDYKEILSNLKRQQRQDNTILSKRKKTIVRPFGKQ